MDLADFKTCTIEGVKNNYTNNIIYAEYPLFKQANIIRLGGSDLTTMTSFIDGKRAEIQAVEDIINALTDTSLLDNFEISDDTTELAYVASVLTSLTTDDQKLYTACVLRNLKRLT